MGEGAAWVLGAVGDTTASVLRYPVPVAVLALVFAPVWNLGRVFGIPLLFWHEDRRARTMAGVAVTLHAAGVVFFVFLLELRRRGARLDPGGAVEPPDLVRFFLGGAGLWASLLVPPALLRWVRRARNATAERPHRDESPGLVAAVRDVEHDRPGPLRSVHFSPWPLLFGALIAGTAVALAVAVAAWLRGWSVRPPESLLRLLLLAPQTPEPWFHILALVLILWIAVASWFFRSNATPAVAICLLLSALAAVDGFLTFRLRHPAPGVILAAAALVIAGANRYKLRLPALAAFYPQPVPYPPPAPAAPPLLDFLRRGARPETARPRPLVLLCASGGGMRAAAWTAGVLGKLDELPGFRPALHMITGASGGMVGATFWLGKAYAEATGVRGRSRGGGDLVARVAGDSLTPVARALALADVPVAFTPLTNHADRGQALEAAWFAQAPEWLDVTFGQLRDGEASGEWPSLVFSPMLVEDGRRLILSNLDLGPVTANEVHWIDAPTRWDATSTSAYHLEALFPGTLATLPLRTAARLSAAFPYVSPAVVLPTVPRRRVVDAGYYDTYGVGLACGWLRECLRSEERRRWLTTHVSRILVVQVRDNVSELSMRQDRRRPTAAAATSPVRGLLRWAGRGFEGITGPVHGLLVARSSTMLFQNDADLETVTELYDRAFGEGFVVTTAFELEGEVSVSWYLTREEQALVRGQLEAVAQKYREVAAWLG